MSCPSTEVVVCVGFLQEVSGGPISQKGCGVCKFIDTQPDADDIRAAMTDPDILSSRIWAALKARGLTNKQDRVRVCRREHDHG